MPRLNDEGIPAMNLLYHITGTLMAGEALKIIQGCLLRSMENCCVFNWILTHARLKPSPETKKISDKIFK